MIIGTTMYHYASDGTLYTIDSISCSDYEDLVKNPQSMIDKDPTRIAIWNPSASGDCKWGKDDGDNPYVPGSKIYSWKHKFDYLPWGTFIKGDSRSIKWNGILWHRWRTSMSIHLSGNKYNSSCESDGTYDESKSKKRKRITHIVKYWGLQKSYMAGDPNAYFAVSSGSNTNILY